MEFIKELKIISEGQGTFQSEYLNFPIENRQCEWLKINDELSLSIQASGLHYCLPKKLVPLEEYTNFEMAIIINGNLVSDISTIKKLFKNYSRYDELVEYWNYGVFGYVRKELLNDFYIYCKENLKDKKKKKIFTFRGGFKK